MIAKLIVHGKDRSEALTMLRRALGEYQVVGPSTNIEFLKAVASHPEFAAGPVETSFIPTHHDELFQAVEIPPEVLAQAALFLTLQGQLALVRTGAPYDPWSALAHRRFGDVSEKTFTFDDHSVKVRAHTGSNFEIIIGNSTLPATATLLSPTEMATHLPSARVQSTIVPAGHKLHIFSAGHQYTLTQPPTLAEESIASTQTTDSLTSPMPATVIEVRVKEGDEVKSGQICCVLESMKMEINIRAGRDGKVGSVKVGKGQTVEEGAVLVALELVLQNREESISLDDDLSLKSMLVQSDILERLLVAVGILPFEVL